jgi:GT2 family glycosyltransferase
VKDVSVIMVNYKTPKMTAEAIRSIFEKTEGVDFEIVLVDNGSTDDSVEQLKKEFGNKIKLVVSKENLGFGRGNNLGMENASGKYFYLMNTDMLLINNAIKIQFDFMEANPNAGIAGANLYRKDLKPDYCVSFKDTVNKNFYSLHQLFSRKIHRMFLHGKPSRNSHNYSSKNKRIEAQIGASLFIRKSVIDKIGGFDPDFFMYWEDTEFCKRALKNSVEMWSVPSAKVIHLGGGSTTFGYSPAKFAIFTESLFVFIHKVYGQKSVKKIHKQYRFSLKLRKSNKEEKLKIYDEKYNEYLQKWGGK